MGIIKVLYFHINNFLFLSFSFIIANMAKGYGLSHVGGRQNNQDSILVNEDLHLYAVADGMGGHNGGEVASAMAVENLNSFLEEAAKQDAFSPDPYLIEAFQEANTQVFNKSHEDEKKFAGMGTTLVVCMIWNNKAFFGNVGDSRAYLFREPYLWRITEDHSVVNNQLKKGLIDEEQRPFLMHANVITRSIGFFNEIQVDLFQRDILPGDLFLLCSDGLNDISDQEICELAKNYSPKTLPQQCINKVLDGKASDNISVIVIEP